MNGASKIPIAPGIYSESTFGESNTDILGVLSLIPSLQNLTSPFPISNSTDDSDNTPLPQDSPSSDAPDSSENNGIIDDFSDALTPDDFEIAKRTEDKDDPIKFAPKGQAAYDIYPENYSGYKTVAKQVGGWFYNGGLAAVPQKIGVPGITKGATQNKLFNYVTEHVLEKQNLRDIIQLMTQGQTAMKKTVATADVTGIFDAQGIFNQPWPANIKAKYGPKPVNTAFGCLGHTRNAGSKIDVVNLEVLDHDINAIKAHVAAFDNPAGNAWKALNPQKKITFLTKWLDVFNYYNHADVSKSFNGAYQCLRDDFWPLFAQIPGAQQGYDYKGVFVKVMADHLEKIEETAQINFRTKATEIKNYWNGQQPKKDGFSQPDIDNGKRIAKQFITKYDQIMKLDANALTK